MSILLSKETIRSVGPFYHITTALAAERILAEGLRPDAWEGEMYAHIDALPGPFFCLSPCAHKLRYVHAIQWKFEDKATVLLEVSTEAVVDAEIGFDLTSTELPHFRQSLGTEDPISLIEAGAPLACYTSILPAYIHVVQRWPSVMGE